MYFYFFFVILTDYHSQVKSWLQPSDVVPFWRITQTPHTLPKRLTFNIPSFVASWPFHPSHPPLLLHAHALTPLTACTHTPSVTHPPPSTSVGDGVRGVREVYKRVRDFRGRAEETSVVCRSDDHRLPDHSPLDL